MANPLQHGEAPLIAGVSTPGPGGGESEGDEWDERDGHDVVDSS